MKQVSGKELARLAEKKGWELKNWDEKHWETPTEFRTIALAMPQSLAKVLIHTIFSTKDRAPCLKDAGFRRETHAYRAGVTDKLGCKAIRIGVVDERYA